MKKLLSLLLVFSFLLLGMVSCAKKEEHVHDFLDATCNAPKTCKTCGETEGEPTYEHTYANGKCTVCEMGILNDLDAALQNSNKWKEFSREAKFSADGADLGVSSIYTTSAVNPNPANQNDVLKIWFYITQEAIESGVYSWKAVKQHLDTTTNAYEPDGTLTGTFAAGSCTVTGYSAEGLNDSEAKACADLVGPEIKKILTGKLFPALEQSELGFTPKDLGFDGYQ